jgi:foldase protein PrsA
VNPRRPALFFVLAAAIVMFSACGGAAAPAATVGTTSISDAQLAAEAKIYTFVAGLNRQACGTPDTGESKVSACDRFALAQMIQSALATNYASKHHITVAEADVTKTIQSLDAGLGADAVNKALASNGVTRDDLTRFVRQVLLVRDVQGDLAKAHLTVAQLHDLYSKDILQFTTIHVEHILVKTKAKADEVFAQVTRPGATEKDFQALAKKVSTDTQSGANGGDLGSVAASQFVEPFASTAAALKPGEISRPVHTQFGWHVIRMVSKQVTPFSQASTQLLQSQGAQVFDGWAETESAAEGVSVNPKYGRFDQQTLAVDRISSTVPASTSASPAGSSGSTNGGQATSSP